MSDTHTRTWSANFSVLVAPAQIFRTPEFPSNTTGLSSPNTTKTPPRIPPVSGVMFTASHNPAQYNGMKFCRAGAEPVALDTGLAEMRDLILDGTLPEPADEPGAHRTVEGTIDAFADHVRGFVDVDKSAVTRVVFWPPRASDPKARVITRLVEGFATTG